jgi:hypothetical protein
MAKMLRKRKQFGRCKVEGHGAKCFCEVCDVIQGTAFTRAQDKREAKKEITQGVNESKQ